MSRPLWMKIILVVSLAFNVAFVVMYLCCKPPRPMHGPEAFEERVTHDMKSSDAAIVHEAFAAHKAEFAEQRKQMDEAIAGVRKVLASGPVSQTDLTMAMDKGQAVRAASEKIMEQVMIEAAPKLSPEGRDQLVPPPPPSH